MATTKIVPSKPALILEGDKKHLIITDLHIGFEGSLAQNKIFVGKNTTLNEFLDEVYSLIDSNKVDDLILLGDIKSGISRISKSEWDEVPKFLQELKKKTDVTIVPGNHDANMQQLVPDGITMISTIGMVLENSLLTHGHTIPSENFAYVDKIIMGHVHPVFFDEDSILNGQRVWVSIKTKKENIFPSSSGELEIIIIPSFNRYFYATKKKQYKKSISPIIERIKDVSSARIVTLDGVIIGNEAILSQVI
ncbi:MAG TPA: metallophosphoesterase [Candidatus Nitrosotenuis sp.]|nr:metallophosphoesterase [Candidatus Nitrosotenuis sp.]